MPGSNSRFVALAIAVVALVAGAVLVGWLVWFEPSAGEPSLRAPDLAGEASDGSQDSTLPRAGNRRLEEPATMRQPEQEEGWTIHGVVLSPEGSPVEGATLHSTGGDATAVLAETDGSGSFTLHVAETTQGPLTLQALDPVRRWMPSPEVSVTREDPEATIRFTRLAYILVEIQTPDGIPLTRATVHADEVDDQGVVVGRVTSPVDVEHLPATIPIPGQEFLVGVTSPSFEDAEQGPFLPSAAPAKLVFYLSAKPGIRGVVLHRGAAVNGARVEMYLPPLRGAKGLCNGIESDFECVPAETVTTGSDGRFLLSMPDGPEFRIHIHAPGLSSRRITSAECLPAARAGLEPTYDLTPGGHLAGRCESASPRDWSGSAAVVYRDGTLQHLSAIAADGTIRFENLAPGDWLVSLRSPADAEGAISAYRYDPPVPVLISEGVTTHCVLSTK